MINLKARLKKLLNIERHFAFYGAYNNSRWNILVHVLFVWPVLFSVLVLSAYTRTLAPTPQDLDGLPYHEFMIFNYSFVIAVTYAFMYLCLDRRAGFLAAMLVMGCWVGSNMIAQKMPWEAACKMVFVGQLICWLGQYVGHGLFERRHPGIVDNVVQAWFMAPFFVLLEVLQIFHYEPYPGFALRVQQRARPHPPPPRTMLLPPPQESGRSR